MRFVVCALIVALPSVVVAQHDAGGRSTDAVDPDTEVATREYNRGMELYEQHQYPEAVAAFKRAQSIKPLPAFDYNIARSYDRMGEWARAVEHYERYLVSVQDLKDAAELRARVEILKERVRGEADSQHTQAVSAAATQPSVTSPVTQPELPPLPSPSMAPTVSKPVPKPSPVDARVQPVATSPQMIETPRRSRTRLVVGGVVLGLGVVVGVTGSILWGLAGNGQYNTLTAFENQVSAFQPAGIALVSVGGAMIVGGVITLALPPKNQNHAAASSTTGSL